MDERFREEFSGFLGGHWHQDMDSPEQALEEMITECHSDTLVEAVQMIAQFLSSNDEGDEWKIDFIEDSTDIYFPNMELQPLDWLRHVKARLEEALSRK